MTKLYLGFKVVWAARSLDENFCDGPKIRVPPCSLPPLAGAHVGRAAVVISSQCSQTITYPPQRIIKQNIEKTKWKFSITAIIITLIFILNLVPMKLIIPNKDTKLKTHNKKLQLYKLHKLQSHIYS